MADTDQVLNLAAIIRKVDGNHSKGAAALAESILDHPGFRAVLAGEPAEPEGREPASVTGQPSDEELLDLLPQGNESGFWLPKCLPSDWVDGDFIAPPKAIIAFARDVLELWGNPTPQPPAEGEVGDKARYLVKELRDHADDLSPSLELFDLAHRAAELLERQVLVAVTWQPIETAPRDGTEILASDYDAIEIVSWVGPRFDVGITGEWTNREGEAMYPAWWQPLPDHLPLPEVGE